MILGIVTAGLLAGMTTTTASSNIVRNQANAEAVLTSVAEAVEGSHLCIRTSVPADYPLVPGIPTSRTGWSTSR